MQEQSQDKKIGYICKCCGQYVKMYSRRFNSGMALSLIVLHRYSKGKYVHLENLLSKKGYQRCGDATYLIRYGLIERLEKKREDGSNRNGYYRITEQGSLFVQGLTTVKSKFLIFNNTLEGFEGDEITIVDALAKKFDYSDLMGFSLTLKHTDRVGVKTNPNHLF